MTTAEPANALNDHPSSKVWNRLARKYANGKISDEAGYQKSLERARAFFSKDAKALEVGCGTGRTALAHAPFLKAITGTDISSEMISIAQELAADAGIENAEFIASKADDIPFPDGSFDVVMGMNFYHLADDLDKALAEARRLIKPGGVFITKTPCLGEMNPVLRMVVLPVMQLIYKIPTVHKLKVAAWEEAIGRHGFDIEDVEFHSSKGRKDRPFIIAKAR